MLMQGESPVCGGGSPRPVSISTGDIFRSAYVVEALAVPFLFFDLEGTIIYANAGAHQQFAYESGSLIGMHISVLDTALCGDMWRHVCETIVEEGTLTYESHIATRENRISPSEFCFQYHDKSERIFITALVSDIAARKNAEGDILLAREEAMQMTEELREKKRVAEEALKIVNELKLKQDGDYYLTSMLLKPFQVNHTENGPVQIDWLVRQKTKFAYKKWNSEIGGDICIADEILLQGRNFTFFVIADAMGKANQGACGALLLAAIVRTYITRTKKSGMYKNIYPERWLRILHDELREGFAGFEGMMMISVVAGLVDQESRHLYFFNAEQPRPVSYLDGKANFIGLPNACSKIGMPLEVEEIVIELYPLQPGETIIFGSDGRDDIRLNDSQMINASEEFFLSLAERAGGDLNRIWEYSQEHGEIIDDYSLLTIYTPQAENRARNSATTKALIEYYQATGEVNALSPVLERNPSCIRAQALVANHCLKAGDSVETAAQLKRYIDLRPDNYAAIFSLMRQYCKLGNFSGAIDVAERITYRAPFPVNAKIRHKILTLLTAIYRRQKNPRAEIIARNLAAEEVILCA